MVLTFNRRSALQLLRALRADSSKRHVLSRRTHICQPNIEPLKRWSKNSFDRIAKELQLPLTNSLSAQSIEIAVPKQEIRIRAKGVTSTVYHSSLPDGAFIDIGNGATISSPELLFVELAPFMHPIEHLMLGHELCGTFARDAANPYNGPVVYGIPPLTSVSRITSFLQKAHHIEGIRHARTSLSFLNDNAWSPTESLLAALLRLPIDSLGYEIGELILNPREEFSGALPGAKESRVPDIMIANSSVGVNYDGLAHFDLKPLIGAAIEVGAHPEVLQTQIALNRAARQIRNKVVDDIRRNRELAVDGLAVLPVTKEDLYIPNGMDLLVVQLAEMLERLDGRDLSWQKHVLDLKTLSEARYRMALSLLPGNHERNVQVGRFISGRKIVESPTQVIECWVEL